MKLSRSLSLSLISVTLVLGGCSLLNGMGDDNTPHPVALANYTPVFTVNTLWSSKAGGSANSENLALNPIVADGKVYTANAKGKLSAFDMHSGNMLWSTDIEKGVTSSPAINDNLVIVGSADAQLFAFNASNGKQVWQLKMPNQILAAPAIDQGKVVIKTIDGTVAAYSLINGQQLWSYQHGSPKLIVRGGSVPKIVNEKVLVGFSDGKLAAYRLENGSLLWEQTVAESQGTTQAQQLVDIVANPTVTSNVVYVGTYQGKIAAINLQSGQVIWQQAISTYTGLALNATTVFVTDANSTVWAFDRVTGKVLWQQNQLQYRCLTAPVLINNSVVVGDAEGYLHWLSQTDGQLQSRIEVEKKTAILATPAVANSTVFAVTQSGRLVAMNLSGRS